MAALWREAFGADNSNLDAPVSEMLGKFWVFEIESYRYIEFVYQKKHVLLFDVFLL